MDSLEINVEPTKGSDELGLEGIATQIDCDDVDLSPARENVKFFSQDSINNRSISTEKSAHEVDRSKHFQKLGSAAFVGMEGLSSPNPNGGGGRGGRGVPVRRRTFHSAGTPGGSTHAQDDGDMGSVQNAAVAASAFLNMPPPRTRQNNAPVTPSVPPSSQSTLPESDQKSDTETQSQRRPSSMFVRRSVVESLFGNEESESATVGGTNDNKDDKEGEGLGERLSTAESNEADDALAAATAAATLYNTSLNTHPNTSTQPASAATAVPVVGADAPVVLNTRSSSDDSVYNQIVRSIPSVETAAVVTVSDESAAIQSVTKETEEAIPTTIVTDAESNAQPCVAEEDTSCSGATMNTVATKDVSTTGVSEPVLTNNSTHCIADSAIINAPVSSATSSPATQTTTHDHPPIHTIQPPGPNKNPAKFVAPTYTQHPMSYLKVGKGTVSISTSVSATANINAGKGKSGQSSVVPSSSSGSGGANNVFSGTTNSEIAGATNAEKAKAMVGVGSVKDRIKKFETLKTDSTDNSNQPGDGKKAPHRRASLS